MREAFRQDFEAVRTFTLQEVGILNTHLRTRDAYAGMSDYINLLHTLGLTASKADVSFAAPLTFNGHVESGPIIFNDLFTIYPFENQLYVVKMSGDEIRRMLEASYDRWIQTIDSPDDHVLKIAPRDDPRSQQTGWSFVDRSYNFDSAGGINYTVDVTKPYGERIFIRSLADGTAFQPDKEYRVAMTSYRANGGGNLLKEAGVDSDNIEDRIVDRYPEIRNILHSYLMENGSIDPEVIGDPKVIGHWEFVPQNLAQPALKTDMALLFR
jgi:2',3'-cyclic-nucleotide 2'-phosphodiesterase/3'-nucleotidase